MRRPRVPRWAVLAVVVSALASWWNGTFWSGGRGPAWSGAGEIKGAARAIDGDSIAIGGTEIRLRGLDAPEGRQTCERDGRTWPCGREAHAALQAMLQGLTTTCRIDRRDQHDRALAVCRAGERDLNATLVFEGWAVAIRRGQDQLFTREEAAARTARRGLWAGSFTEPNDWRRERGIGGHGR
jgi:endonuclease YncB( thermonuclease family)